MSSQQTLPTKNGTSGSVSTVDNLLLQLERNPEDAKLSLQEQERLLERVKVFGRDPKTAGAIFSSQGIITLARYGLDQGATAVSREALKCLANAFLLHEPARQIFVDAGYAPKAVERLESNDRDDEFLISRLLLLTTYETKLDFVALDDENHLADTINEHIARHAKSVSKSGLVSHWTPMQGMALLETLKLLFNVTHFFPTLISRFAPSVSPLVSLILRYPWPDPPLQPPVTSLLHALHSLNLQVLIEQHSTDDTIEELADRLVAILDLATTKQSESVLDEGATILCGILHRIVELDAPRTKPRMCSKLLPQDKDRDKPLGTGDSLPARLLRLSVSPGAPRLGKVISILLFELSDLNPSKFIQNIGYGYGSGFLMSKNIPIPSDAVDERGGGVDPDVNPVTGQRLSAAAAERTKPEVEMTEEEKEREAERLFVLFERLRATGVMDVENPVQQAVEDGRFEELPDE